MQTHDPILNFVLRRENLPATLDILKRADVIRRDALRMFWDSLLSALKATTPRQLTKRSNMRWVFWPSHEKSDANYYGLYFADSRFAKPSQYLSYCVRHYISGSSFEVDYGIMWEKQEPTKSRIQQMPQVEKLRQSLNADIFTSSSSWWLGKAGLFRENSAEEFLKRNAEKTTEVKRKVCQDFWQLIDDTFDLVAQANQAVQRRHQR
jgi:hypothetical protein